MKKLFKIFSILLFTSFFLSSCNSNNTVTINGSNTTGDWYNEISKIMGGYKISMKTKLTITRNGPGNYEYKVEETVIDEMYGGVPKTKKFSGSFEEDIVDKKWRFKGGSYGESGGYILIPEDNWDDYKPDAIRVEFSPGRGNPKVFKR